MSADATAFLHADRERTIVFGPGALDAAAELVAEPYTLLTTPRAAAEPLAAALVARAAERVEVPAGLVETVAAELRPRVLGERLLALGGGRVIDVAKALAAADPPRTVVAVPTTLSGAEMTRRHRHAGGVDPSAPWVLPALVLNDPALSASAPIAQLAASSANALAHALTAIAAAPDPLAAAVARDAVARIAGAWRNTGEPDRAAAALGALLAGWAVDHSGLGLHHVLAQTAVRTAGLGHAEANAALLPVTAAALRRRAPDAFAALDARFGAGALGTPEALAAKLRDVAGVHGLGPLTSSDGDAEERLLDHAVEIAAKRPELAAIPPAPDRAELRALYRAARR